LVITPGPDGFPKTSDDEVNWIIETKGRVWEGTEAKDEAITEWCRRISEVTEKQWRYARVNQIEFDSARPKTLGEATSKLATAEGLAL
jgi:hypothetical protein